MVGIPENELKLLEKNEIDDQMVQGLFKIGLFIFKKLGLWSIAYSRLGLKKFQSLKKIQS